MSIFSKDKKVEADLVILAESGLVQTSIVKFNPKKSDQIISSSSEEAKYLNEPESSRLENIMLSTLKRVLEKILSQSTKDNDISIKRIRFVLGSPWYIAISNNIEIKKEEAFFTTQEEIITELNKKETENKNLFQIDRHIISITANGYKIDTLKGKKAKEIKVTSISHYFDNDLRQKISEIIKIFFPHTGIKFETFSALVPESMSYIFKKEAYLLLIPDHEVADIVFVKRGKIRNISSIPFGKNYMIRTIMNSSKITLYESAKSLIKLFLENKLEESKKEKVKKILSSTMDPFLETIRKIIWQGMLDTAVHTIFVINNSPESRLMWQTVIEDPYCQGSFGQNPELIFVEAKMFKDHIENITNESEELLSAISGIGHIVESNQSIV